MSQARIEMDAVILPTGNVLALGGSASDEDASTASRNADLYDPGSNSFSSAGANNYPRLYHSVALLLPDATVWIAGSNPSRGTWESSHGDLPARIPVYAGRKQQRGPGHAADDHQRAVQHFVGRAVLGLYAQTQPIFPKSVLVRPGSSTHAFDMDQRLVGMSFTVDSGSLTVTAPPNSNIAPPGYYMLFLINNHGVPSVARFVLLNGSASNPAPDSKLRSRRPAGPAAVRTAVTITGTGFLPAQL